VTGSLLVPEQEGSEFLGESHPELTRVITQDVQDVVLDVECCVGVPLVGDVPAIKCGAPAFISCCIGNICIDDGAILDLREAGTIVGRLSPHLITVGVIGAERHCGTTLQRHTKLRAQRIRELRRQWRHTLDSGIRVTVDIDVDIAERGVQQEIIAEEHRALPFESTAKVENPAAPDSLTWYGRSV